MLKQAQKNMIPFDIRITDVKVLKKIQYIVKQELNKKVIHSFDICNKGTTRAKARKIILNDNTILRVDRKYSTELNRLQQIATDNNIEMQKTAINKGMMYRIPKRAGNSNGKRKYKKEHLVAYRSIYTRNMR